MINRVNISKPIKLLFNSLRSFFCTPPDDCLLFLFFNLSHFHQIFNQFHLRFIRWFNSLSLFNFIFNINSIFSLLSHIILKAFLSVYRHLLLIILISAYTADVVYQTWIHCSAHFLIWWVHRILKAFFDVEYEFLWCNSCITMWTSVFDFLCSL